MEVEKDIRTLLIEKLAGKISEADNIYLEDQIARDAETRHSWEELLQEINTPEAKLFLQNLDEETAWKNTQNKFGGKTVWTQFKWTRIAAVFILLVGISGGVYLLTPGSLDHRIVINRVSTEKNETVKLVLANGKEISIGNTRQKINTGSAELTTVDNRMSYTAQENSNTAFNTLIVPAKKDYKIVLSDGSEVWLNSQSTLKFPILFPGDKREVFLQGEAFFKVSKNPKKPFIVHTDETSIQVLGTSFNVNAYSDNMVTTSLVEGAVMTTGGGSQHQIGLNSGEQAIFYPDKGFERRAFDEDNELSWMKGVYNFHNMPLYQIANVLSRWYDVSIVFEDHESSWKTFSGSLDKARPIQDFFNKIQATSSIKITVGANAIHVK